MRHLRALISLVVVLAASLAVVNASESTTPGRINAERVNVRSGPALSDRVLGTVKQGDIVQVVAQKATWLEIEYPAGCYMWTSTKYVKVDEPANGNWGEGVKGSINGSHVRIRVSPDLKAAIIREAEFKEGITVLGKKGDWYFLKADSNLHAFISASLVDLEKVEPKVEPKAEPAKVKPEPEQSVSSKPVAPTLSMPVVQTETVPEVSPAVAEVEKRTPEQMEAAKRTLTNGATADGVIERVPATTAAETGCSFRLIKGGLTVNYLRGTTVSLDGFANKKVTIHGSLGAKAGGHDQRIINVEFVEAIQE